MWCKYHVWQMWQRHNVWWMLCHCDKMWRWLWCNHYVCQSVMHVSCVTEVTKASCMMDVMLLWWGLRTAVMEALYATECDACIMCDRHDKSTMYDEMWQMAVMKALCVTECDACVVCDRSDKSMIDVMLIWWGVRTDVMNTLYVTECDACIMCDRRDKVIMYDWCNVIMTRCDNGCDVSIMCDGMWCKYYVWQA